MWKFHYCNINIYGIYLIYFAFSCNQEWSGTKIFLLTILRYSLKIRFVLWSFSRCREIYSQKQGLVLRASCLPAVDVHREAAYSKNERCHGEPPPPDTLHSADFRSTGRFRSEKKLNLFYLVFYVCETWPLASKEGGINKIFRKQNYAENIGPVKAEVSDVSKIQTSFNEELCDLYNSLGIIRVLKFVRIWWVGHIARMGQTKSIYKFWWRNVLEKVHLKDWNEKGMAIFRKVLGK
jgi:hypothetical protein